MDAGWTLRVPRYSFASASTCANRCPAFPPAISFLDDRFHIALGREVQCQNLSNLHAHDNVSTGWTFRSPFVRDIKGVLDELRREGVEAPDSPSLDVNG
jgi:hypothetical protein